MRVLVVEDEPMIRLLACDILEAEGWSVVGVSTAAAALAAARAEGFDAAVIDLGLPDSSGAALLERLAALRPGLRVVISTGR
ncbi:MAG: response regulator, partial [Acetobacteraceae bacterium]|nr:response regulator [Acetobacteraceae bacterium]